jgi:hypothetical protein
MTVSNLVSVYFSICLSIVLISPIFSQRSSEHKKGIFPIAAYSNNTGILLGGMILNQGPEWDSHAFLFYSEKYGKLLIFSAKDISLHNKVTLETSIKLFDWKDSYFKDDITTTKPTEKLLNNTQYELIIGPRYWISEHLSTALLFNYTNRTEYPDTEAQREFDNEHNMGTKFNIQYETRNDHLSATHGTFAESSIHFYPAAFRTGKNNLITWTIDYRYYYTIGKHTWATRTYLGQTLSPKDDKKFFISQFRIGNVQELRGEEKNRFMGRSVTLFQYEYRYQLFEKIRPILFIEAGQTTNHIGINNLNVTKGLGIHYTMKHNVIFRLEVGIAEDTYNTIFSFNTAF